MLAERRERERMEEAARRRAEVDNRIRRYREQEVIFIAHNLHINLMVKACLLIVIKTERKMVLKPVNQI